MYKVNFYENYEIEIFFKFKYKYEKISVKFSVINQRIKHFKLFDILRQI